MQEMPGEVVHPRDTGTNRRAARLHNLRMAKAAGTDCLVTSKFYFVCSVFSRFIQYETIFLKRRLFEQIIPR